MKDIRNYGIVISLLTFIGSFVIQVFKGDIGSLSFALVSGAFFCTLVLMKSKYEKKVEADDSATKAFIVDMKKRLEAIELRTGFEFKGFRK